MKKTILLLLVASLIGTAVFFFMGDYFRHRSIASRIRELNGVSQRASTTALDRGWWAPEMPMSEEAYAEAEYKPGVSHGRGEWIQIWSQTMLEAEGSLVRITEDLVIGPQPKEGPFKDVEAVPATWTWHQGQPNVWGERVKMSSIWTYHDGLWKLGRLEEVSKSEAPPPPAPEKKKRR